MATEGWESVVPPPPPPPAPVEHGMGWEMVLVGNRASAQADECSVFPPSNHEGLHIIQLEPANPPEQEAVASLSAGVGGEAAPAAFSAREEERAPWQHEQRRQQKRFSELARHVLSSAFELVRSRISGRGGGGLRCPLGWEFWPYAALACLIGAVLCLMRRYRSEKLRLLLLIQEKDQRIGQLLHQIAQMNDVTSSRRRVYILRSG